MAMTEPVIPVFPMEKDGNTCNATEEQIALMEADGWSRVVKKKKTIAAPAPAPEKEAEDNSGEDEKEEKPASLKKLKKSKSSKKK